MKNPNLTGICAAFLAGTLGTAAVGDEIMNTAQLRALITGNTLYINVPAGAPGAPDGGTAPIYYGENGAATALLPAGIKLVGTWALKDDQYCIDWNNGPKGSCSQLRRGPDGFQVMDVALGKSRGLITQIAIGNAENL